MARAIPDALFDEILDFLASTPTPEQIVAFQPPMALQQRLGNLLAKSRDRQLMAEEQTELDEFLRMNRFMSRLKLKARQKIGA